MINLLPPDLKEQYVYGRRNVTLRRWAIASLFGLAGVLIITIGGLIFMEQSIQNYRDRIAAAEQTLASQNLERTRAEAKKMSATIKLATDVLSKEVLFSQLLTQVATVIPPNTNLTDLNISSDQSTIEIKAVSSDYTSATQLQLNLQDPANKIFSKADIQTITCNSSEPAYPCNVAIKALLDENNAFLLVNKQGIKR